MLKKYFTCLVFIVLVSCANYKGYFKVDGVALSKRALETRRYETKSEKEIIVASAQVLQDLGFIMEESNLSIGLLTANKTREAGSTGGKVAVVFMSLLSGQPAVYDVSQLIKVTLVTSKSRANAGYNVRITFSRIVVNNMHQIRSEPINDIKIYEEFFDKLSKSVFLTANNI